MPSDWSATHEEQWLGTQHVTADSYRCGYCGVDVASQEGLHTSGYAAYICLCPQCNVPTFFSAVGTQIPGPLLGGNVGGLQTDVEKLYKEARLCITVDSFTGAVMLCRKILMNVSVEKGAKEGLHFVEYVKWLVNEGYAPKGSQEWVEYIKDRGNDANHQIIPMAKEDAIAILGLTEQLLRNMFELPGLIPPKS